MELMPVFNNSSTLYNQSLKIYIKVFVVIFSKYKWLYHLSRFHLFLSDISVLMRVTVIGNNCTCKSLRPVLSSISYRRSFNSSKVSDHIKETQEILHPTIHSNNIFT